MQRANLDEILVFLSVVDEGSFVAGGQAMGLTRSAAGKAVARLEDRLGVRLLNRTTRALSLTDEGRVFHERGQQVLAAVEEDIRLNCVCVSPIGAAGEYVERHQGIEEVTGAARMQAKTLAELKVAL